MDDILPVDINNTIDLLLDDEWLGDEPAPDFKGELKGCAAEIIMDNPAIDKEEWIDTLLRQFPCEVVDAYGTDEQEVYQALSHLWETDLADPVTEDQI